MSGGDEAHLFELQQHLMRAVVDLDVLRVEP